jgi:hypothetical protein
MDDRASQDAWVGHGIKGLAMSEPTSVRKFEFRLPRTGLGCNVEFLTGGAAHHGICKDVSEAGVRAELEGSVVAGNTGLLILRHPAGVVKLTAQVAYVEDCEVGLVFHFETLWERKMTSEFIASISGDSGTSQFLQLP